MRNLAASEGLAVYCCGSSDLHASPSYENRSREYTKEFVNCTIANFRGLDLKISPWTLGSSNTSSAMLLQCNSRPY